ncbi:MAG: hypothetical protein Q9220_006927 [cf. Caloplaca sp. 1 TL-2023]
MLEEKALDSPSLQNQYDLVCVGFGPASLAIAIALHDRGIHARVLYLEKQPNFIWHAGMLLPDARMQTSFLKDLATLRDPTSKFTFINYLKSKNRLVAFTNLSTFLPLREEYNDYLSWCASHFEQNVQYGHETISVSPLDDRRGPVSSWQVTSRNVMTNQTSTVYTRSVVIAIGGKPRIPPAISKAGPEPRIIHSSSYSTAVAQLFPDKHKPYTMAVIGGGQSSAEIFNNLQSRYPSSHVTMYIGGSALKPSDDSPFVNEIFDPERVDTFYDLFPEIRQKSTFSDKSTNYGVVRPQLLDHMYENMYHQRLREPDPSKWQFRIVPCREVVGFERCAENGGRLRLRLKDTANGETSASEMTFDLVILGTGYERKGHEKLLESTRHLLQQQGRFAVARDYRIKYRKGAVARGSGVWLQGCCEDSHGVSRGLITAFERRHG